MKKIFLILAICFILPQSVFAITRTYTKEIFVDCKDGDNGNSGASGSPVADLDTALGKVNTLDWRINIKGVPGDSDYDCVDANGSIVYVAGYSADGRPGVIQGYGTTPGDGVRAVIDGDGTANPPLTSWDDYTVFADLVIQNAGGATSLLWYDSTGNNRAINLVTDGNIDCDDADWDIIMGCDVTGSIDTCKHQIYYNYVHDSSSSGLITANLASPGIVYGNIFEDNAGAGIFLATDGYYINNTMTGNTLGNILFGYTGANKVNVVINNIFEDSGATYHVENYSGKTDPEIIEIWGYNNYWNSTTNVIEDYSDTHGVSGDIHLNLTLGGDFATDPNLGTDFAPPSSHAGLGSPPNGAFPTNSDIDFNSCAGAIPCGIEGAGGGATQGFSKGR
jgi:hypothetical protein